MSERRTEARVWFGVLAAPVAWTLQHVSGYFFSEARCAAGGSRGLPYVALVTGMTTLAALAAIAGLLAALAVFRSTESETPPPEGRRHFLGVVGLTLSPLFLCIVLLSGIGSIVLDTCRAG